MNLINTPFPIAGSPPPFSSISGEALLLREQIRYLTNATVLEPANCYTPNARFLVDSGLESIAPVQFRHLKERAVERLVRRFSKESGYPIFGREVESAQIGAMHAVTITLERRSRSIPAGPIAMRTCAMHEFGDAIPEPALMAAMEALQPQEIFDGISILEPIAFPRHGKARRPRFCRSLDEVRASRTARIDPIMTGRFGKWHFLFAHWD